ncbi:MAG: hypothetical protein SGJ10_14000 [Bacteroidota bacterium]|nr:hypothetical protein [Bacteroidota bacterium]
MGLTIHYNGRFNPRASLGEMVAEVKDIVEIFNWKYTVYETEFPSSSFDEKYNRNIYGISLTPPECETVSCCFLSNGRMSSKAGLKFFGKSTNEDEQKYLYMLCTKTQFADYKTHMLVVGLLRYLSKKYFSDFTMTDEGKYWETESEDILKENFKAYNDLLNMFSEGFQSVQIEEGESLMNYLESVIKRVKSKRE